MSPPAPALSRRSPLFLSLFHPYTRHALGQGLDGVRLRGLATLQRCVAEGPVLLAATHVSTWDALVILALDGILGTTGHALMDAQNLERLPFFGWIGAVPIDRSAPGRARSGMKTAAALLQGPGDVMWIFPQGRQRPPSARPLDLQPGVRLLYRMAGATLLPISLAYHFGDAEVPGAWLDVGEPLPPGALPGREVVPWLDAQLCAGLDRILAAATATADHGAPPDAGGHALLLPSRRSRPENGLGARILNLFGGSS